MGRASRPYAFTEQGVAMLSSVLQSPQAVQVNVEIMRAFVRLRQVRALNADLARPVWNEVADTQRTMLESTTFADLAQRLRVYHI